MENQPTVFLGDLEYLENEWPVRWIHPKTVVGIDLERTRSLNQRREEQASIIDERTADQDIVDYLCAHLLHPPENQQVDASELVDGAIYLIEQMWSIAAAARLGSWADKLVTSDNVAGCFDQIRKVYCGLTDPRRYLLREFCLDFFSYHGQRDYKFRSALGEDRMKAIEAIWNDKSENPYLKAQLHWDN